MTTSSWPRSVPAVPCATSSATHGAVQLSELMRFADPAESAASLALRDGDTAALGFYLDNQRVHVGDLATMTDHAFTAWRTDTAAGLDSIMLAPTRLLVAELNQRARDHRLTTHPDTQPGRECAARRRLCGQCRGHRDHPQQRPQVADLAHRLGEER